MQSISLRNKSVHIWKFRFGDQFRGHVSAHNSQVLYNKIPKQSQFRKYPILLYKNNVIPTNTGPKHIFVQDENIFVSCLEGKCVQHYIRKNSITYLKQEYRFKELQCIASFLVNDVLYVTLSKFSYNLLLQDKIGIIDLKKGTIKTCDSHGNWSKFINKHPTKPLLFVSNWYSNDISVLDIENALEPRLKQIIKCGISPRDIAFVEGSKKTKILVACYYSRNIIEIQRNFRKYRVTNICDPYDTPHYSGNFRSIILSKNNDIAIATNMGRNLVVEYDIKRRKYIRETKVGKFPNSIISYKDKFIVSCQGENLLYVLDDDLQIIGVSEKTGDSPTGLQKYGNLIISTSLRSSTLEFWDFGYPPQ